MFSLQNQKSYITEYFSSKAPTNTKTIDKKLNKLVGQYLRSIYQPDNLDISKQLVIDMKNHYLCCSFADDDQNDKNPQSKNSVSPDFVANYTKHDFLRDLFLWTVLMDMPEMAKVFLLRIPNRICGALLAAAIFKSYSRQSPTIDLRERFVKQSLEFEIYAANAINKCYQYDELRACEILLRRVPLFGNISCMQVFLLY